MIKLSKSDYNKILDHAIKDLPDEACGLIAGTVEGNLLTNLCHLAIGTVILSRLQDLLKRTSVLLMTARQVI